MTPRPAFPPKPSAVQLGPTAKPGVCAFAWRLGCGQLPARFLAGGWRCERCGPLAPALSGGAG